MAAKPDGSSEILEAVALLVIDMQGSFLAPIADSEKLLVRCGLAVASARALGIKVLFTEQVPDKLGHTDERLLALASGARVFPKNTFSALQAEGIREHLKRLGVYHLLIIGIEMPVCIYQTALHARDSDFDVTVLSDCVGGRRPDDCQIAVDSIARAECHVLPSETVFYSMLGDSSHPIFRKYTDLVKHFGELGCLEAPKPAKPERKKQSPRRRGREKTLDAPKAEAGNAAKPEKKPIKKPERVNKAKKSRADAEATAPKSTDKQTAKRKTARPRRPRPPKKT